MRTLLLNDSRCERHLGSELTMRAILSQCDRAGLQVIRTWPITALDDARVVRSSLNDFDLLLVNGEGTMHDDQPKALSLAQAVIVAAEAGKRVALVNSVWQNNREANRMLPHLDVMGCRESLSTDAARQAGGPAQTVPDAIFSLDPPTKQPVSKPGRGIVTDSVFGPVTRRLAWLACRHGLAFAPLWSNTIDSLRRRRLLRSVMAVRCGPPLNPFDETFLEQLAQAESVITGRFHAACLCFWLGVPVAAVGSNSYKIQGLYRDAGYRPELVRSWPGSGRRISLRQFRAQLQEVAARPDRMRLYAVDAKKRIETLFDHIRKLPITEQAA